MPDYHFEEYVYLAGLTHKTAVIAWGGFFFRVHDNGAGFKLVDDGDLDHVFPPRDETIGERSRSYGPALVTLIVRPIAPGLGGTLEDLPLTDADGMPVPTPIRVSL